MIKSRISLHPWIIRIICKTKKKKKIQKDTENIESKLFATNLPDKTDVCLNSVSLVSLVKSVKLHRILRNCSVYCAIFQCTIMFIKLYLYCIRGTKQKNQRYRSIKQETLQVEAYGFKNNCGNNDKSNSYTETTSMAPSPTLLDLTAFIYQKRSREKEKVRERDQMSE